MNIKEAKEQIKNAVLAYTTKDQFGNYVIPPEGQRPVFLMGPPGIGKTAVMSQIASELGMGLVSYSMTHHTRQSALGLPFIVEKNYGGKTYQVSEYTMSEILATVYDLISETGIMEGILFLDEINCVSETLAPSMLQFLQYKVFGRHRVPDGWIVVTAGNPPEYNSSVRDFDIVTWDRLKRIDIEPDFKVWKEYACNKGIHPAVLTYLEIKKQNFYDVRTTVDGKNFVTARGWSDLSDMLQLYEQHNLKVNEKLVSQYLQNKKIATDFAVYYELFRKYSSDYQVDRILSGNAGEQIKERARNAKFDERISLLGLIFDRISEELQSVYHAEKSQLILLDSLKEIRDGLKRKEDAEDALTKQVEKRNRELEKGRRASSLSRDEQLALQKASAVLEEERRLLIKERPEDEKTAFLLLKGDFDRRTATLASRVKAVGDMLSCMFRFCEEVFGEGQEILILVTELTISRYGSHFIGQYGCKEYFSHNRELLFYERRKEILAEIESLELGDADGV